MSSCCSQACQEVSVPPWLDAQCSLLASAKQHREEQSRVQ